MIVWWIHKGIFKVVLCWNYFEYVSPMVKIFKFDLALATKASRISATEVCDFLVKQGAFIAIVQKGKKSVRKWSKATWRDWTALHMAARNNQAQVGHCVAKQRATPSPTTVHNYFGIWPWDHEWLWNMFQQNVNTFQESGFFNMLISEPKVIRVLIDNGALKENQHFVDAKGQTPLHIAIAANQDKAAEVLVLKCPAWISAKEGLASNCMQLLWCTLMYYGT